MNRKTVRNVAAAAVLAAALGTATVAMNATRNAPDAWAGWETIETTRQAPPAPAPPVQQSATTWTYTPSQASYDSSVTQADLDRMRDEMEQQRVAAENQRFWDQAKITSIEMDLRKAEQQRMSDGLYSHHSSY